MLDTTKEFLQRLAISPVGGVVRFVLFDAVSYENFVAVSQRVFQL
jgi:hypothetical protein